ncbi:MAG: hypothetical protein ACOH2T_18915 [Pseudomonas sp.]
MAYASVYTTFNNIELTPNNHNPGNLFIQSDMVTINLSHAEAAKLAQVITEYLEKVKP